MGGYLRSSTLILMEWRPDWVAMSRLPRVEINAAGNEWVSREWERERAFC